MRLRRLLFLALLAGSGALACGSSSATASSNDELNALGEAEVLADLTTLGDSLGTLYASIEQKKAAGFDLDHELVVARDAIHGATTERDRLRPIYELIAKLQDPGITIAQRSALGDDTVGFTLPVTVVAAEGKYVLRSAPAPFHTGDVLVAIDGTPVAALEAQLRPFVGASRPLVVANAIARMLAAPPYFAPEGLRPKGTTAHVEAIAANGAAVAGDMAWRKGTTLDESLDAQLAELSAPQAAPATDAAAPPNAFDPTALGVPMPDYWTRSVASALAPVVVAPSAATLQGFSPDDAVERADPGSIAAVKLAVAGKKLLLVRIPTFSSVSVQPLAELDWLAAVLDDEKPDAVIVDVTNNTGGSQAYMAGVASMFLTGPVPNVNGAYHADRENLTTLLKQSENITSPIGQSQYALRISGLNAALDANRPLGAYLPVLGLQLGNGMSAGDASYGALVLSPHPRAHFGGPVLVLQNERTAGYAEAFARILQTAGAKVFGSITNGAGTMLQSAIVLPHSQLAVTLPRGLLAFTNADLRTQRLVSEEAAVPDFPRDRSVADIVDANVAYANAFVQIASTLTR